MSTPATMTIFDIDGVIIDCFSLLFRAFHAFPATLTAPDGQPTNAVFGFTRLILDMLQRVEPHYLMAAIDMGQPTFRHEEFAAYKAHRPEPPTELKSQIPLMKEVLQALNIPTIGVAGFEADDVIGTLARQLRAPATATLFGIMTGDKDAFQLVGDNIYVLRPGRKPGEGLQLVDAVMVEEVLGVPVAQVVDWKALCGDSSDNIPGVAGIGPKTAQQLLQKYGSLDAIYAALDADASQFSAGTARKLMANREQAYLSQRLARIHDQVPCVFTLPEAEIAAYDKAQAVDLFHKLGFTSLINRLPADSFEASIQTSLF